MMWLRTPLRLLPLLLLVWHNACLALLSATVPVAGAPPEVTVPLASALNGSPAPQAVSVLGETGAKGLFDPSLMWSAEWGTFMSYSSISSMDGVRTRIASYDPASGQWILRARVNEATPLSIPCGSQTCVGGVVHETSSLVLDPTDSDPARRVKIFTHSYFVSGINTLKYNFGFISLFTSERPWTESSTSTGSSPWTQEALLGWRSASPFSSNTSILLNNLPGLDQCVFFTEPSALVSEDELGSRIDLALGCVTLHPGGGGLQTQQVLLRSRDHAASFTFVSVLLTGADLVRLGFDIATSNAAQLYRDAAGRMVLLISPEAHYKAPTLAEGDETDEPGFDGYAGCIALAFDDERTGTLQRVRSQTDAGERLLLHVAAYARASEAQRYCGACSFHADVHAATGLGILMSTLYAGERTDRFQILASTARASVPPGNLSIDNLTPSGPPLMGAAVATPSFSPVFLAALFAVLALSLRLS